MRKALRFVKVWCILQSIMLLSYVTCLVGISLELCAVLLLLRHGLWRQYAFFFTYALWVLIANSTILLTDLYFHASYPVVYWHIDSADIALRLLVVFEVFRQTFPKNSGLNRTLSKGLGIVALVLLAFGWVTFWGYQNDATLRSVHLALERSFGFVEALMILGTLVMARYYGVKCGRNIRGIAFAFGAWVSIYTANSAMLDLTNSFRVFGDYFRPVSFVFMLVVWVWSLWVYEPNPPIIESSEAELDQWTQEWNRTILAARTIIRP